MLNKMKAVVCGVIAGVIASSSSAMAAVDLTGITFPVTEFEALAALILGAIAVLWVIRKLLALPGRG